MTFKSLVDTASRAALQLVLLLPGSEVEACLHFGNGFEGVPDMGWGLSCFFPPFFGF